MESLQFAVKSRVPSATDAVIGACGILAGWWLANLRARVPLFCVWLLAMLTISWQPFAPGSVKFDWIPGLPLERGNPLFALEEMITKLVLFGLGGALAKSPIRAALGGLLISGLCEWGQTIFGSHSPCITDVMLGVAGMAIGCRVKALTD